MTAEEDVIAGCIAAIQALRNNSASQLSMNHYEMLFYAFVKPGITRTDIAEQSNISTNTVKRCIKDLLDSNLMSEIEKEEDFRYKSLHLTENGYKIISTVVKKMQDCASCLKTNPNTRLHVVKSVN
ncbi:MAG: winged helix-turn-helix transcriptional regulator [Pseudomonadota bacterium]